MVRGRLRADTATLENWRDEKDPVQRRRLRQNLYNRRQRDDRARQARIDAQNGDSTDEALEMEQAEDAIDQKKRIADVDFAKGWRNILPAPKKP